MVAIKLTNHLQINNLLYDKQFGFQYGKSTEHHLLHLINYITNSLNNNNYCIGIFLDLKKAFDVCSHSILLKKLKKFGIDDTALLWFKSYLANRKQRVELNGTTSSEQTVNVSVLQGSILGPTLFLCYINDIFTATDLFTLLFADDTACLADGPNLKDLIKHINLEIQKLANWFRSNKMAVNISKTKFIIFRNKGKKIDITDCPVLYNNNELDKHQDPNNIFALDRVFLDSNSNENKTYKLLGILFDEYLSFEKHISYICAKISRSIYCVKRASNKLSVKALVSLYQAIIHPHFLYCLNIMSCSAKKNIQKLNKLQKKQSES